MAFKAVRIDQHGIGGIEQRAVVDPGAIDHLGRPAHVVDVDLDPRHAGKRLLQQQAPGPEFVHPRWMARPAGDEDDAFGLAADWQRGEEPGSDEDNSPQGAA